jgi:hypothetical protein
MIRGFQYHDAGGVFWYEKYSRLKDYSWVWNDQNGTGVCLRFDFTKDI